MTFRSSVAQIPFARKLYRRIFPAPPPDKRIADPTYNAVVLKTEDGLPLPPIEMRDKVRKSAVLAEDFVLEGAQAYQSIKRILADNKVRLNEETSLYEFGVGCGRIARHFLSQPLREFYGSDVDSTLVEWCTANLEARQGRTVRFFSNSYLPPLDLEDGSIDVLYSISVITHMTEEAQLQWLNELSRVVKPGGVLLLSYLGLPIELSRAQRRRGIFVRERIDREFKRNWLGKNGAPEIYFNTYNTAEWLASKLQEKCEVVAQIDRAIRNHQHVLLLRKR